MYNYLEGFIDPNDIKFCSRCGSRITEWNGNDDTGICSNCGFHFGVIAVNTENMEENKNGKECFE